MFGKFLLRIALAAVPFAVAVSCDGSGNEPVVNPEITISGNGTLEVSSQGETVTLDFSVDNPVEGGTVDCKTGAEWIRCVSIDPNAGEAVIEIDENMYDTERRADVVLSYLYDNAGNSGAVADTVSVLQRGVEVPYDRIFEATYFSGEYFGDMYGNDGETNYAIIFSDAPGSGQNLSAGGTYYQLDIFSSEPSDLGNILLPEGEYRLGPAGETEEMTFTSDYSYWFKVNGDGSGYEIPYRYFTEGVLKVSYEDGTAVFNAELVDEAGERHKLLYSGDGLISNGLIESSLEGDVDVDCSEMGVSAIYYGDFYFTNTSDWFIIMASPSGEVLQLDICTSPSNTFEDGLPAGRFVASSEEYAGYEGEFVRGYIEGMYSASWYYNEDQAGNIIGPLAPLRTGEIIISINSDGSYTINVACGDDDTPANMITAEWTGFPEFIDESFMYGSGMRNTSRR